MLKNNYKIEKKIIQKNDLIYGKIADKHFICKEQYFTPAFEKLLCNPDYYLESIGYSFFKHRPNDTTTVGCIDIDDTKLVIKRYNIKSFQHLLRKFWRKSKAMVNWENSFYLQKANIDTLNPIAVIEERFFCGLFRSKAYFISLYVDGIKAVDYFFATSQYQNEWQTTMLNIIALMQKLYQARIQHDDLQCGNMLIIDQKPLLLDLDHMKVYGKNNVLFKKYWKKDVEHFQQLLLENQGENASALFSELLQKIK